MLIDNIQLRSTIGCLDILTQNGSAIEERTAGMAEVQDAVVPGEQVSSALQ
jgi:hypothetical protein